MKLTISKSLLEKIPLFNVSCYIFSTITKNDETKLSDEISKEFDNIAKEYQQKYSIEEVVRIPKIKATRDGYKALGKDPSHTRAACEALLRRILKNGTIYRLGDLIDIGNLLSIKLMKSICMVDLDKIDGDIYIRLGKNSDEYYGINRGKINVENIPLYTDNTSPFGNPTSDTIRTAITNETKNVCIMLINFDKETTDLDEDVLVSTLNKFLKITNLEKINYEVCDIYDER